ncbi:hypothetical protein BHE82_02670 [Rice orange leaf phytoplasma]|nr:type I restriction endonuclease [Rice orange leaf phytoplasma]OIJ44585.1 hypothetical protein BHE82_02670 [Rice orange leaf phytoplasma]
MGYAEVSIKTQEKLEDNFKRQFIEYNSRYVSDTSFQEKGKEELNEYWFSTINSELLTNEKMDVIDIYKYLRKEIKIPKKDKKDYFYFNFFNKENWCKNIFQVAQKVPAQNSYKNESKSA